ncbi:hypothetical protein [Streptomyces sp. NPDC006784]|uniref:hypothetical protein n=1 Tax=Streptomyces sp. NPDC006784 TaxID=3364764 RepID=UPI0036A5A3EF
MRVRHALWVTMESAQLGAVDRRTTMRRHVTAAKACLSALVLLLSVLLAAEGTGALLATASGPAAPIATAEDVSPSAGHETEHGAAACHPRRTVRHPSAPPAPGERPPQVCAPRLGPPAAAGRVALPGNGSAGMPWRRSAEVLVLHQVLLR